MNSFKTFVRTAGMFVGLAALGVAHAATVENLGGTVRVNQGRGYASVRGTGTVQAGDTVMADVRGNGRIVYEDGCTVELRPGRIVTITEPSPCAAQREAVASPSGDVPTGLAVAGGAAALGGAAAALAASGGGGGGGGVLLIPPRPASP